MLTFQDFEAVGRDADQRGAFILKAIEQHRASAAFKMAVTADTYDKQQNKTINDYMQMMYTLTGVSIPNYTASNAKLASNYHNRCCTQRVNYLLGNGIRFSQHLRDGVDSKGNQIVVDETKEALGLTFDHDMWETAYAGLNHGEAFTFVDVDRLQLFRLTEFVPLPDEDTSALRAGIRFWQLDDEHPLRVELFEEDGYTKYKQEKGADKLTETAPKRAYKITKSKAPIDEDAEITSEENYDRLPIIPFWGSRLHQSVFVGKQQTIDTYDIINSGFANNVKDCGQIFWMLENYGGMTDEDLIQLRDRLMLMHIGSLDTSQGGKLSAQTQEVPYEAHTELLKNLRAQIYEDYGALDVHTIAAGATNDHIDAAYQGLDDVTDDLEFQISQHIQQILAFRGIEDVPTFKRNKISNQPEQTRMIIEAHAENLLDDETAIGKLPFVTPDEVRGVLARLDAQNEARYTYTEPSEDEGKNKPKEDDE